MNVSALHITIEDRRELPLIKLKKLPRKEACFTKGTENV
jgi:hypothetical protein